MLALRIPPCAAEFTVLTFLIIDLIIYFCRPKVLAERLPRKIKNHGIERADGDFARRR